MNLERYLAETRLLNYSNRKIQNLIRDKNWNDISDYERIGSVYSFVQNDILFGYNESDEIPASKVTDFDWFDAAVLSFKLTQSLIGQADELLDENTDAQIHALLRAFAQQRREDPAFAIQTEFPKLARAIGTIVTSPLETFELKA